MKNCIVVFLLFHSTLLFAQNKAKLDSLNKVLETAISKKERVNTYNEIANTYSSQDSAQRALYTNKAIQLSKKIDYSEGISDAYYSIGWSSMAKRYYTEATALFEKALAIAQSVSYKEGEANAFNGLGGVYLNTANYSSALEHHHKSLKIKEELGDKKGTAASCYNIGLVYHYQGNYPTALEYYLKSLKIGEELGDKSRIVDTYGVIGNIYYLQGNYPFALEYYLKGLKISEALNDKGKIASFYGKIGVVNYEQRDYPTAFEYALKSLKVREEMGDKQGMALSYTDLGNIHYRKKEYPKALEYFSNSLNMGEETGSKHLMALSHNNIGEVYIELKEYTKALQNLTRSLDLYNELGLKANATLPLLALGKTYLAQKQYTQAIPYLEEATQTAQDLGRNNMVRDGAEQLALAYEGVGRYKDAYATHKLFKTMADSLINEENTKKITSQAMQYEFDKEKAVIEQENMKKQAEKEQALREQGYILFGTLGGLILMLILALVMYRNYRSKQRANQLLSEQNEEIKMQREEIQVQAEELRTSNEQLVALDNFKESMTGMLVHDLKNPLNTIVNVVEDYSPENNQKIKQAGNQLDMLVSNILDVYKYENSQMAVTLTEIGLFNKASKAIDNILLLAQNKSIEISNTIGKDIYVKADRDILLRVFINLLSNAIKYSPQNSTIQLSAEVEGTEKVLIKVSDSGKGIEAENLDKVFHKFSQLEAKKSGNIRSTGLGLTFCKMAVEAQQGEISVESEVGKGSTFIFSLPLVSGRQAETLSSPSPTKSSEENIAIQLTSEDKALLKPFVEELSQTLVFEVGKVNTILQKIDETTASIESWKNEVNQSVLLLNEKSYKQLLNIARNE